MITAKTLEILNNQDWETIIYKLTLYVRYKVGISQKDDSSDNLKKGLQPDDFALKAIELVYTGERKWDSIQDPDLLVFLKYSVINSLLSSYFKSTEVKTTVRSSSFASDEEEEEDTDLISKTKNNNPLADEELIAKEALANMRERLNKDPEALLVFEELITGNKPAEIAAVLEIPIEDIRNIIKRIRRKINND